MIDRTMKYNLIYYEIFIYDKIQYKKQRGIYKYSFSPTFILSYFDEI